MSEQVDAGGLKTRIRADLTTAMKARDTLTTGTLRMALAAITNAEVAGEVAKELTDLEVTAVITKEVKKRHESIEIYRSAGRDELADKESAEAEVLERYLPQQLSDDELAALVAGVVSSMTEPSGEAPGMKQMGAVIKAVKAKAGAQADGARVATAVKAALA
ncbi:MAG: GatB/YqeY domain-containing protein [Actinobacteria bacterium]|nr:GatB/YqeY domain-containing protein [Actinomycetota bacterium]